MMILFWLQYIGLDDIGYTPGQMGDNLAVIDLGTGRKVSQMSTGLKHTWCVKPA